MKPILAHRWLPVLLLAGLSSAGCGQAPPTGGEPPPPPVDVSAPLVRTVTDYEEFTGRLDAVESVLVRARVNGYLDKINFQEGAEVPKGEVLFEIDPRPYQAQLEQDQADLQNRKAVAIKTEAIYKRGLALFPKGAASKEDLETERGDWEVAKAGVEQGEAKVRASQLNLDYTKVKAPITGRISRILVTRGNVVVADTTILTTIVSLDPIYAYFDVDERTLLRLRRTAQPIDSTSSSAHPLARVEMGLADEEGYSLEGTINFEDNMVDPSTGTIQMRGVFANPKTDGQRLLSPGLFARIRLPVGKPHKAILVSDRVLGTDQAKKFLYVLKEKKDPESGAIQHVVERRYVQLGTLHDGLREIKEELRGEPLPANQKVAPDEKVVVDGLQRVRQGAEVIPHDVKMPVAGPATTPSVRTAPRDNAPAGKPTGTTRKTSSR